MKNKPSTTEKFYVAHFANRAAASISLRVGEKFNIRRKTENPSTKDLRAWIAQTSKHIEEEFEVKYEDDELAHYLEANVNAPIQVPEEVEGIVHYYSLTEHHCKRQF